MLYIVENQHNQIVDTNIDDSNIIKDLASCGHKTTRVYCKTNKLYRRQCSFKTDEGYTIIMCSYDSKFTNKIFGHYKHAFEIFSKELDQVFQTIRNKEHQKTRRLKHNIITHSSNIHQELYKLFPQESFRPGRDHIETIKKTFKNDEVKAAYCFLKLLKNSSLMKAELDVYEMMNTENPYMDFAPHPIHKVLILTLNPFWLDLVEKNVTINIDPCYDNVTIDYKSISVVLFHIFDNAAKYIMPYSDFRISFKDNPENSVRIVVEMTSLKVETSETEAIFQEYYSGCWAKKLELEGDGIGMFVVKKLAEMNNGRAYMEINTDDKSPIMLEGVPYENNRVVLELNKAV